MRKWVTWISIGMLSSGCQTHAATANEAAGNIDFTAEAIRLTDGHGDVVLLKAQPAGDRKVALVVRYIENAPAGGALCTLFIVEQAGSAVTVVETSDEFLTCNNAPGAELVKHALEARVEPAIIRLEEQHVRSHSTFDFARTGNGRWHLIYGDHVGPENNPEGEKTLLVSNTIAYAEPAEGPTVSDFSREAISKDVVRSVIE